jgi:PHD/YefM family antitoxin component YafN of YafNO toxin-antitoxin module
MLDEMEKTISMAQVKKDVEGVFASAEASRAFYRITRRGHRTMVLVDEEYLDDWIAMIELVAHHPNWQELIEEGERELRQGRAHELHDILKELGLERSPDNVRRTKARSAARTGRAKGHRKARAARKLPSNRTASR